MKSTLKFGLFCCWPLQQISGTQFDRYGIRWSLLSVLVHRNSLHFLLRRCLLHDTSYLLTSIASWLSKSTVLNLTNVVRQHTLVSKVSTNNLESSKRSCPSKCGSSTYSDCQCQSILLSTLPFQNKLSFKNFLWDHSSVQRKIRRISTFWFLSWFQPLFFLGCLMLDLDWWRSVLPPAV